MADELCRFLIAPLYLTGKACFDFISRQGLIDEKYHDNQGRGVFYEIIQNRKRQYDEPILTIRYRRRVIGN